MYIHNLRIKKNSAIFSLSLIYIYIYMCVCVCVCVCVIVDQWKCSLRKPLQLLRNVRISRFDFIGYYYRVFILPEKHRLSLPVSMSQRECGWSFKWSTLLR